MPSAEDDRDGQRDDPQPGPQHAEPLGVLQERGVDVEQREHAEEDRGQAEAGAAQARDPEQPGVQERVPGLQLPQRPGGEQHRGGGEPGHDDRAPPTRFRALDDPDEQRDRRADEQQRGQRVERQRGQRVERQRGQRVERAVV
ncbi:hypothetical protein, partial [Amycolatopsis sp. SID8362]|uniref:hypothetical protein n=1 Tax=Amycolatopsis sp. SID8362 TaxID=2690346 RepID=UPI0019409F22